MKKAFEAQDIVCAKESEKGISVYRRFYVKMETRRKGRKFSELKLEI